MPKTPAVSDVEERAYQEHLNSSCNWAMLAGVLIYALDAVEPWLDFHDLTSVRIQIGTSVVIALIFSLSLFGWGKRHKLTIVTAGLLVGALSFEFIVYRERAFNTAYSVGFPVLFAYYAVLLPVRTRVAASVGAVLLLLDALPNALHQPDIRVVLESVISNFTSFAIILYARILANRSWHREFVAQELITDFVTNIAHECETPVAAIRTSSTMLREREISAFEFDKTFEQIQRLSSRVEHQLRALIEFGRLESKRKTFKRVAVDPRELVEDTVYEFENDPSTKGVVVNATIADDLPLIRADYDSMKMVLWNLLDNARKYSPDNRTIWLRLNCSNRIFGPRNVRIAIEDRGIGIPKSEMRTIYTKFVRGELAKKRSISGTGIGLSIVRQIILEHNGKVTVKSDVGKGSTFTVLLPTVRK